MNQYCKVIGFFIFFSVLFSLNAQSEKNINEVESADVRRNESAVYDKTGIILSLSAFNYFSAGIGFNKGDWFVAGPHFAGGNYGILLEYNSLNEMHLRVYRNIYGGASAVYMGVSAVLSTNFKEITGGLSPEIGLGFPGVSIFYRYNFYFYKWDDYNRHEIVLLIYPLSQLFN